MTSDLPTALYNKKKLISYKQQWLRKFSLPQSSKNKIRKMRGALERELAYPFSISKWKKTIQDGAQLPNVPRESRDHKWQDGFRRLSSCRSVIICGHLRQNM